MQCAGIRNKNLVEYFLVAQVCQLVRPARPSSASGASRASLASGVASQILSFFLKQEAGASMGICSWPPELPQAQKFRCRV